MTVPFRKIMHLSVGFLVVLLGIAGLVLPILNGTLLLIIGFIIISFESPYVEKKLFTLTQKNKTVHALYLRLEKALRVFFRKHK
jgi:uncharacterized membrane protein YbaN (DUF454 family)